MLKGNFVKLILYLCAIDVTSLTLSISDRAVQIEVSIRIKNLSRRLSSLVHLLTGNKRENSRTRSTHVPYLACGIHCYDGIN
jgi:hypothetical protein